MKGRAICFEGIDLCGKDTQLWRLKEKLDSLKIDNVVFREPGGTKVSELVREILLHKDNNMGAYTEYLLFFAARNQLFHEKILPSLQQGKIVLLNRFFGSTYAYQVFGRQVVSERAFDELRTQVCQDFEPDLTFLIKIPIATMLERKPKLLTVDRIEQEKVDFYERVMSGYDVAVKKFKNWQTLDGKQSIETIYENIWQRLKKSTKLFDQD